MLIPPRRPAAERLDDPDLPSDEMARSLADIALVNRRWGGSAALARLLRRHTRTSRPLRILDVGAGSGDVAARLLAQLRRRGVESRAVASDVQWRHLAAGRRMLGAASPAAAADAFCLPFSDGAFDWTISTLFFHHFSPAENGRLLREMARVSREGIAVLDLRRHLLPLAFVQLAGRLLFRSRVSLEDGVASVRQAYTPEEARPIADRALSAARVEKVFPFRLMISGQSGPRP